MTTPRIPSGRAATLEAKRAVLERLFTAWNQAPHQRLGQLLDNALNMESLARAGALFTVEDEPLLAMVERFVEPVEISPTATNTSAAPIAEKPLTFAEVAAATLAVKPGRDAIAAIERGAFVAIAQSAARAGITWADAAAKVVAAAEPEKRLLAVEVINAARRRGELEPGLTLLVSPTAISSPPTAPSAMWATAAMPMSTAPCGCHACAPPKLIGRRMILCPKCGNKRCPKATHHDNACTNSNEPGQPGSPGRPGHVRAEPRTGLPGIASRCGPRRSPS